MLLANERQRLDAANRKAARAAERVFQTLCRARRHRVLQWAVGLGASGNLGPSCWVGLANTTFRPQPVPSAVPTFPGVRVEIPARRSPESLQSWAAGPHRATGPRLSGSSRLPQQQMTIQILGSSLWTFAQRVTLCTLRYNFLSNSFLFLKKIFSGQSQEAKI